MKISNNLELGDWERAFKIFHLVIFFLLQYKYPFGSFKYGRSFLFLGGGGGSHVVCWCFRIHEFSKNKGYNVELKSHKVG